MRQIVLRPFKERNGSDEEISELIAKLGKAFQRNLNRDANQKDSHTGKRICSGRHLNNAAFHDNCNPTIVAGGRTYFRIAQVVFDIVRPSKLACP